MGTIANCIVQSGIVPIIEQDAQIETATNCYPGRLVKKGTGDKDIVVGTAGCDPMGWLGYEQAGATERPATITTAYAADDIPPVLKGGGFTVLATLAVSQTIAKDAKLAAGANGSVTAVTSTERVIGYADESVTTDSSTTKTIKVRSLI